MQASIVFKLKPLQFLQALLGFLLLVDGAPSNIDSGTLETAKGSPTLGAGYSETTNAFYSSCLDFNDDNIVLPPSYNHECEFIIICP